MRVLPTGDALHTLWPRVWALTGVDGVGGSSQPSDGTDVWFIASQCGAEQLNAPAPAGLADEALEEWLKWFARG